MGPFDLAKALPGRETPAQRQGTRGCAETICQPRWSFLHVNPVEIQGDLVPSTARRGSCIPPGWQGLHGAPSCLSPPCPQGWCHPLDNVPRISAAAHTVPAQQELTLAGNARDRCTEEPKSPAPAEQGRPLQHPRNARGEKKPAALAAKPSPQCPRERRDDGWS